MIVVAKEIRYATADSRRKVIRCGTGSVTMTAVVFRSGV
jgi:hypothetical protein